MDLQMPEMDGYTATRVIRTELNNRTVPIIAMTAHALVSERQHCLDCGMNDYVSKPVDPEHLLATLLQWIRTPLRPRVEAPPVPGARAKLRATAIFQDLPESLPGIDIPDALKRLGGNRKLLGELLCDFVRDYGGVVGQFRDSLDREDFLSARRMAHTLRGIAGNLSAADIAAAAREVEEAIESGDGVGLSVAMGRLDNSVTRVVESLTPLYQQVASGPRPRGPAEHPPTSADLAGLATLLVELDHLLKKNSLTAKKCFAQLQEELTLGDFQVSLAEVEACLARLDFKQARRHLAALAHSLGVTLT
jgi:CheY-like chemotaxis protein